MTKEILRSFKFNGNRDILYHKLKNAYGSAMIEEKHFHDICTNILNLCYEAVMQARDEEYIAYKKQQIRSTKQLKKIVNKLCDELNYYPADQDE